MRFPDLWYYIHFYGRVYAGHVTGVANMAMQELHMSVRNFSQCFVNVCVRTKGGDEMTMPLLAVPTIFEPIFKEPI